MNSNKINYDTALKQIIKAGDKRILLHACCAPCATHALSVLSGVEVTVFYYNPSIMPKEEHDKRLSELKRLCGAQNIPLILGGYDNLRFLTQIKGFEQEREGGARCEICFRDRLSAAAIYASKHDFDYFCTTLTVSPHKNSDLINKIGFLVQEAACYLASDFKKAGGYAHSVELSAKLNLYRQSYCGCIFSNKESNN